MRQIIMSVLCVFFIFNFYELTFVEDSMAQEATKGDPSAVKKTPTNTKTYALWVGSSRELVKAELEKGLYAGFGQPVVIVTVDLKAKGVWHRTYVGNFSSQSEAEEFKKKLEKSIDLKWSHIITLK